MRSPQFLVRSLALIRPPRSIRSQILLSILAMFTLASSSAALIAVINGRTAVDVEIHASMDFAERYLREIVRRLEAEDRQESVEAVVAREVSHLRHARVFIQTGAGAIRPLSAQLSTDEASEGGAVDVPPWFRALMLPADGDSLVRMVLVHDGKTTLVIKGDPEDEIAEKWSELSELAILWFIVIGILLAAFHFLLGRILDPLISLSRGLSALEAGKRAQRLEVPNLYEVGELTGRFNALAQSLDQTRAENGRLYRQIVSVQEEERRHIARELHDEAGPCLFGITATAESVGRIAERIAPPEGERLSTRAHEIVQAAVRLKAMNRALLRRLHPVSLRKVPIAELIRELIEDVERRNPAVAVESVLNVTSASFGEAIDLTIYRCVQEALTNAVRHGRAQRIFIHMTETLGGASDLPARIEIEVRDDGCGLKQGAEIGFGLAAMRERILAAGGSLRLIPGLHGEGAAIQAEIPIASTSETRAESNMQTAAKLPFFANGAP